MKTQKILLEHGDGGKLSHELIENLILPLLGDRSLGHGEDSEILDSPGPLAFTTDSFVVDPIFFPGGDIGRLSVCGTVNDLASRGAQPLYLTLSLILEEGFKIKHLERIVKSVRSTAEEADLYILAGDVKVLPRRKIDSICINTAGIGVVDRNSRISIHNAKVDDDIIVTGTVGDHALSVLSLREGLGFERAVVSDCVPLNGMVQDMLEAGIELHCLKDPTRGGLLTSLNEIAVRSEVGMMISESAIPVAPAVRAGCEMLGLDPLYLANEGKMIIIAPDQKEMMNVIRSNRYGKNAKVIGKTTLDNKGTVLLEKKDGTKAVADMLIGAQLPRLC